MNQGEAPSRRRFWRGRPLRGDASRILRVSMTGSLERGEGRGAREEMGGAKGERSGKRGEGRGRGHVLRGDENLARLEVVG